LKRAKQKKLNHGEKFLQTFGETFSVDSRFESANPVAQ
jgi:hypothetical protein